MSAEQHMVRLKQIISDYRVDVANAPVGTRQYRDLTDKALADIRALGYTPGDAIRALFPDKRPGRKF